MKTGVKRFRDLSPGTALTLYYFASILLGTIALSLPFASVGAPLSFIDALFTATSAQCVTGLIVVDTGTKFTLFGQLVILTLIQIGGLGITTFSVYIFFYLNMSTGTRGRWIINETLLHTPVESMSDLLHKIFAFTFVIEGLGALFLATIFVPQMGLLKGVYYAAFHSISAFCNAGFSLFPDSLVRYQGDYVVNITIMALIILGGIGFLVIKEVFDLSKPGESRRKLSLHSKLVFITTAFLIVGGALLICAFEYKANYAALGPRKWMMMSLFQSVTARTAGFNSIDLTAMEIPSLFLLIFLMFIGASPGSAGGGIKTTSLALFVAILFSRLRGDRHTNVLRRTIPDDIAAKALTLVMLAALFVALAILALLAAQSSDAPYELSRNTFLEYAFEAVSAFATVGLSLGATAKLNALGKLIIIVLMFVGRVGLLTLAFAIIRSSRRETTRYSEENIMIG